MGNTIIIVAMTEDRVIGKNGTIPWHIGEDLRLFKELTLGKPVIMGRKTYESLGRPLSDRRNLVVSRTMDPVPGVEVYENLERALGAAREDGLDVYLIGGESIYREGLRYADTLYISLVKESYPGDTRFPPVDETQWKLSESREYEDFTFTVWKKTRPPGS
ncbi:MAG: dihydrofolate reductase [Spirochaetales bacterium]|nr:dihydrofolate reductase [Spirochaetales bacterium]